VGCEFATASFTVLLLYLGAVKPHHRRADPLSALGRGPTAVIAAKPGETGGFISGYHWTFYIRSSNQADLVPMLKATIRQI
jgi:hypothetical protein